MTGDQVVQAIGAVMMLVLVGASLLARRLPWLQVARMAGAWVLIFAIVLVGYAFFT